MLQWSVNIHFVYIGNCMNINHRFILRPLAVSVFVAMSATGCAIDDDMNATRHANLIINHADPLAISAKEAHKRAELAKTSTEMPSNMPKKR